MRVWQVSEDIWIAGDTLLSALRAARKDLGQALWEFLDREWFREVPRAEWEAKAVYDPERPDVHDLTLASVVHVNAPGVVMTSWDQ